MAEISDSSHVRIRILLLMIVAVISVLLARLYVLQAVRGGDYKQMAEENRIRRIALSAPRGEIIDRNGEPLIKNRLAVTLTLDPDHARDKVLIERLSRLLGMPVEDIKRQVRSLKISPIEPRVIKRDVDPETIAYVEEHDNEFEGVELKVEAIRDYPNGSLGAHIVGYLGELSEDEMAKSEYAQYKLGDLVGKSGIELQYENILAGGKGTEFVEVNAAGRPVKVIDKKEPDPGNNVVLTIDKKIQASAEKALFDTIKRAKKTKYPKASAGAIVVMTTKGEVLAMASYPTYDPRIFVGGISAAQWASLTDKKSEYPLSNRAIMSGYPPGSTFKVATAIAGLKTGVISTGTTVVCRGRWFGLGKKWGKWCWDRAGHGTQSLEGALRVSCDTFFYEVGHSLYRRGHEDLQDWARRLGFGSATGIDLPAEAEGRVPTAAWKKAWNKTWPENQVWFPGDTVNMAIGQGDLLVTPLQLADLYAAIANGGTIYRPHVVKAVIGLDGQKIYEATDKKNSEINLTPVQLAAVRRGLRRVVVDGTAAGAFSGFKLSVSGKTGTAEVVGKDDYSGFVAYAPSESPQYVISAIIEQGGHGGTAAAPAVRQVLGDIYGISDNIGIANDESR